MSSQRVIAIFLRQFYLILSSFSRVLPLFIWVAIDIVLWGFISKFLSQVTEPGFNALSLLLGAVLLWDFFTRVMHGVTTAFLEDVWTRNFLNLFASPLKISEYVTGLVLTSLVTSVIGLAVMYAIATLAFGLSYAIYGAYIFAYLFALLLFGIALGIFGSAVVLKWGPASEWFVWPIPAIISPFAGVFYPIATLPVLMQQLAYAMPPAHVFEAMRAVLNANPPSMDALFVTLSLSLAYILLAALFFQATYRKAVKTGLLARYSAESVS